MNEQNETTESNSALSEGFLNHAHRLSDEIEAIGEAFKNPGIYPFELVQTALLLSIAHGIQALNEKLNTEFSSVSQDENK
jgi:hypothetical protein